MRICLHSSRYVNIYQRKFFAKNRNYTSRTVINEWSSSVEQKKNLQRFRALMVLLFFVWMALHNDLLKIKYVSNVTLCDNHIHLDLNLKLIFSHLKLCVAVPDFHTVGFKKKRNTASKKNIIRHKDTLDSNRWCWFVGVCFSFRNTCTSEHYTRATYIPETEQGQPEHGKSDINFRTMRRSNGGPASTDAGPPLNPRPSHPTIPYLLRLVTWFGVAARGQARRGYIEKY